jgi:hypothetical protein
MASSLEWSKFSIGTRYVRVVTGVGILTLVLGYLDGVL